MFSSQLWGRLLLLPKPGSGSGREGGWAASCCQMPSQERRALQVCSLSHLSMCMWRISVTSALVSASPPSYKKHLLEAPLAPILGHGAASLPCCHFFLFVDITSLGTVSPFVSAFSYDLECEEKLHSNVFFWFF